MVRFVLGVAAGIIAAFVITFVLEQAGHAVFTLPAMPSSEAQRAVYMSQLDTAPKLALLTTWFFATLAGSATAAAIGRRRAAAWWVAGVMIAMAGLNFYAFPHPLWMIVGAISLIVAAGWLAPRAANVPDA